MGIIDPSAGAQRENAGMRKGINFIFIPVCLGEVRGLAGEVHTVLSPSPVLPSYVVIPACSPDSFFAGFIHSLTAT